MSRVQTTHMMAGILMLAVSLAYALAWGMHELPKSAWYTYAAIIVALQAISWCAGRWSVAQVRSAGRAALNAFL